MFKRNLLWACIVLLLVQVSACSGIPKRHWSAIEGRVLDKDTEQPIDGALVVALWKGVGGYSRRMCFHVETVKTDKNGIYLIPGWLNKDVYSPYFDRQHIELVPYKAGYNYAGNAEGIQYLKKFEGSSSERIAILRDYSISIVCIIDDDESKRNLNMVNRALYEEAAQVAETREDKKELIILREIVERYELGGEEAYKRAIQRSRELGQKAE